MTEYKRDGRLILIDFLLVLTVARVDVLCGAVLELRPRIKGSTILTNKWDRNIWLVNKIWMKNVSVGHLSGTSHSKSWEEAPKAPGNYSCSPAKGRMAYIGEGQREAPRHRWNTSGQKGDRISTCTENYFRMWCFLNCSILFELCSDWETFRLCDITYFLFSCSWNQAVFQLSQPPLFSDKDEHISQRWKNKNIIHFLTLWFRRLSRPSKEQETNNHLLRERASETALRGFRRLPGPGEKPFTGDASSPSFNVGYWSPVLQLVSKAGFECSNALQRGNDHIDGGNGRTID